MVHILPFGLVLLVSGMWCYFNVIFIVTKDTVIIELI